MQQCHPAWIEIDFRHLRNNIALVQREIGETLYCLPIKADAYGHGLCPTGKIAEESGVDYLAVAHVSEGIQLRQAGLKIPILVLGAIHEDQIIPSLNFDLELTISSQYKAELVHKRCLQEGKKCRVHLEVDTGMRTTGVRPFTAKALLSFIENLPFFDIVGVYSHLATSEDPNDSFAQEQIKAFKELISDFPFKGKKFVYHLANSTATLRFPTARFNMVRPAMLTLGYGNLPGIQPCFALKARVSYVKLVNPGEGIGYGHSFIPGQTTRIVTIPVGYGDGYLRALSNCGSVLIQGAKFPIVGTVCMDQFMVDVGTTKIRVGDEVVLIGKQGNQEITVSEIAKLCKTIPYEILCLFKARLPKIYLT